MNARKGLYAYQKLTYGIASAPALFQYIHTVYYGSDIEGNDKVHYRIDDIIIRTDRHEHLQVLGELLIRLERQGILANKSKCEFMVLSIKFLDYRVDGEGQNPKDEKIAGISKAPSPKKKREKGRTPLLLRAAELLWKFYS